MKISKWTKLMAWIDGWTTPQWLRKLFGILQDIIWIVLKQVGKEALDYLMSEIIRASKLDISGREKLEQVVSAFRQKYINIQIGDSALNLIIELLLQRLKQEEWI